MSFSGAMDKLGVALLVAVGHCGRLNPVRTDVRVKVICLSEDAVAVTWNSAMRLVERAVRVVFDAKDQYSSQWAPIESINGLFKAESFYRRAP